MGTNNSLLPKEVVALVQHIELNKGGWWNKSVHRLVLAAVWLSDKTLSAEAIQAALKTTFRLSLSTSNLTSALTSLQSKSMLLCLPDNTYRIPEQQRVIFENEIADSERVEREAKDSFCKLVANICEELEPEKVWEFFEYEFLGPLVKQVGANAYHLVAGEKMTVDNSLVDHFLKPFSPKVHNKLRMLVTTFLDPKKSEVCAYISRMLHARFCVDASGLPEDVLAKLNAFVGKQIRFVMFVDTNFLFSLLELHENPSNAAAQELRELVAQLNGNPLIKLVITPETIEEAKKSIAYTKGQLQGLPPATNFTQVALQANFSGMAVRFLTEKLRSKGKLTAEEWFDPYLNDFVLIARSKGVEIFNEKLDSYSTRQDVVDDIHVVFKYEERLPENRRKSYPKVAHDMVLWHFVNDKRPSYVETPIDANYWILTVDFRFIGFDEHKRKHAKSKVPLCIHPTSLIQLLQFWVPRTKEFEEAMLGSLRLPFFFQDFDAESEKISLKILKGIGKFDRSETFSQDTITHVILNDGLRSRLQAEHSAEEEIALIRDALVEEMTLQVNADAEKAKELKEAVLQRDSELDMLKKRMFEIENKEKERAEQETHRKADFERKKARFIYGCLLILVSTVSVYSALRLDFLVPQQLVFLIGTGCTRWLIGIVTFIFCHLAVELSLGKSASMNALWLFKLISRFRGWLWSFVILSIAAGIVASLLANKIQQNLDSKTESPSNPPAVSIPKQTKSSSNPLFKTQL